MVCEGAPVPLTVMVAVRSLVVSLTVAVTVTVPSLLPDEGATVSHVSLLTTSQYVSDVTSNVFCSPEATKLIEVSETVNVGVKVAAACVTDIVCEDTPVPLTVMVAVRSVVVSLAVAVTVTVASLLPEEGVTVSQVALLPTFQFVFDDTLNNC